MEQLNQVKDYNIEYKIKEINYLIHIYQVNQKINKGILYKLIESL